MARIGHLKAHDHHQREAEEQEQQPGHGVLHADDLVVERKHPRAQEPEFLVPVRIRVTMTVPYGPVSNVVQRPTPSRKAKFRSVDRADCMQKAQAVQVCSE